MNWSTHYTNSAGTPRYGQYLTFAHSDRKWDRTGYAMLMSPNKNETAVHNCHCRGDMAVLMRKVLAIPRSS